MGKNISAKELRLHKEIICGALKINTPITIIKPKYKYEGDIVFKGKIIILRNREKSKMIQTLAHEMRHKWQYYDAGYYFKDYISRELLSSSEEYNRQLCEVDANAFSFWYMYIFCGCYDFSVDNEYHEIVKERMSYIEENEQEILEYIKEKKQALAKEGYILY